MKRIIIASSDRSGRFDETTPAAEMFAAAPYSLGAIRYNLEKLGWSTCYAPLRTTISLRRLARLIDEFKPDIVYTYGSLTALHPLRCRSWFCRHKKFKVIHGWDDVYGEIWDDIFGKLPGLYMRLVERAIIKQSDGVVTLSRYNQQRGRHWGIESAFIPNGADIPQYDLNACNIRLDGRFNLVYTGAMDRWKLTHLVCAAMRKLPVDIKLYLTGQGSERLTEYASDNCIFLGYVAKNDQLAVMAQADALVVTANQDCNAKLQEYLRYKKPIIGYDGRLNLFFENGRNALLTHDYAAAIERLAADPELCRSLAANAATDIEIHTWTEIAKMFDDYFRMKLDGAV